MLSNLFQLCYTDRLEENDELKIIELSLDEYQPVHLPFASDDRLATARIKGDDGRPRPSLDPLTAWQHVLKERIRLPNRQRYPMPATCSEDDSDDRKKEELLRIYQQFALELNRGVYVTQILTSCNSVDVHAQLSDDLETLRVDQGRGVVIEFPLSAVSTVDCLVMDFDGMFVENRDHRIVEGSSHAIVLTFARRQVAFSFPDLAAAQNFQLGMELLCPEGVVKPPASFPTPCNAVQASKATASPPVPQLVMPRLAPDATNGGPKLPRLLDGGVQRVPKFVAPLA